jgi:hypothetical protein
MFNLTQLTGAPVPYNVTGTEVMLYPLTFRDWGTLEGWARSQVIKSTVTALEDIRELKDKKLLIREAVREATSLSMAVDELRDGVLGGIEGKLRIVSMSISKGDRSYTVAKTEELIQRSTRLLSELAQIVFANSFATPEDKEEKQTDFSAKDEGEDSGNVPKQAMTR